MKTKSLDYKTLLEISEHLGLPIKKLLDMLWSLKSEELDNNELIRKIGVSRNSLNQAKSMLSDFLTPPSTKTALNEFGQESIKTLFPTNYSPEEILWSFLKQNPKYDEIVYLLKKYESYRVKPKKKLDQYNVLPETEARRALLLDFFSDIKGKRILFLGIDFTSIAVSYIRKGSSVHVLDIDQEILDGVASTAKDEGLQIGTTKYDAREELPTGMKNNFDVVFIDPPYTIPGISLFLSRAIEALDTNNQSARIYLSYGSSDRAKERFLPVYEVLIKSGLMIRWIFDKFNRYETGAESIGSSSSLFICDTTSKSKTLVKGVFSSDIYTR